ncbi:MAG: V-type ATP synthase subunit E family protein [Clostridia bacterium]
MNSKEALTQKIISDAGLQADAIIAEGTKKAQALLDVANAKATAFKAERMAKLQPTVDDIIARSKTVANLDSQRYILGQKKDLIDKVFAGALQDINNMDKKQYLSIIAGMIKSNAEDGDEVVVCEKDKKVITKAFIDELAHSIGKKITLSKEVGNFDGGIVLSCKGYDKNLTLELELEVLREEIETEIAGLLFEEKVNG